MVLMTVDSMSSLELTPSDDGFVHSDDLCDENTCVMSGCMNISCLSSASISYSPLLIGSLGKSHYSGCYLNPPTTTLFRPPIYS